MVQCGAGRLDYVCSTRLRAVHEEHRRRYPPIRFVCRMKPATSSPVILLIPAVDEMGDDQTAIIGILPSPFLCLSFGRGYKKKPL